MLTHLIFDTETLGVRENAAIATIACVPFTFGGNQKYSELVESGFFAKICIKDQIGEWKRKTEPATLEFWSLQSKDARERSILPSSDDLPTVEALTNLAKFIKSSAYDFKRSYIWCRGIRFDFGKLEAQYEMVGIECPFNSWKARDVRTYIDILTGSDNGSYNLRNGVPPEFVKHHALHDAALDAAKMIEIFQLTKEGVL